MICPKCKGNNTKENRFCIFCGKDLTEESKIPYILAILATVMTMLSFSLVINIITILVAITSIVLTIVKKLKIYRLRNICLGVYAIIASIIWIIFLSL